MESLVLKRCIPSFILLLILVSLSVDGRKHHLDLKNDDRHFVMASSFGFQQGGLLTLTVSHLRIKSLLSDFNEHGRSAYYGFTIDKSRNSRMASYFEKNQEKCLLDPNNDEIGVMDNSTAIILVKLLIDFPDGQDRVELSRKGSSVNGLKFFSCPQTLITMNLVANLSKAEMGLPSASPFAGANTYAELKNCSLVTEEIQLVKRSEEFFFSMAIFMSDYASEGAYSVVYHNCPNYGNVKKTSSSMMLDIIERNGDDYLAVGERFSPMVYFTMSVLFFGAGVIWAVILRRAEREVFKLHYVMLVLIFLKAISLLFHGVNFHFISKLGAPIEGWAILFYVTHLLKGALLFITLVLIGTGWAFIKNFLTSKEKKIFLIVIPFQVLANIAWIVLEESETGDSRFMIWEYVFMFVDFFCCGCILIPIVWSIRHLSEAAGTDGKAASNLRRMRLFRRFYMLVVCYIYFTRIVVLIFDLTVSFRYTYLNNVFQEGGTFIFFILTGYTFRPTRENPYLKLAQNDDIDEVEMEDVVVYDRRDTQVVKRNHAEIVDEASESLLSNQIRT